MGFCQHGAYFGSNVRELGSISHDAEFFPDTLEFSGRHLLFHQDVTGMGTEFEFYQSYLLYDQWNTVYDSWYQ